MEVEQVSFMTSWETRDCSEQDPGIFLPQHLDLINEEHILMTILGNREKSSLKLDQVETIQNFKRMFS